MFLFRVAQALFVEGNYFQDASFRLLVTNPGPLADVFFSAHLGLLTQQLAAQDLQACLHGIMWSGSSSTVLMVLYKREEKGTFRYWNHIQVVSKYQRDKLWLSFGGWRRGDTEEEEGISNMIVGINLDTLILLMTARQLLPLTADNMNYTELQFQNKRSFGSAAVVRLNCQALNQHWHPAGCAGQ